MSNEQQYAQKLVDLSSDSLQITELVKLIINQGDTRHSLDLIREEFGMSAMELHRLVSTDLDKIKRDMNLLRAALYLRDLEENKGKGTWRSVADSDHLIKGVVALRTDHPDLDVGEAKVIVEAYKAGLFK